VKRQMRLAIASLALIYTTTTNASPIEDPAIAVKAACIVIHVRLKAWPGKCESLVAELKGSVWTVFEMVEGVPDYRPPVVKLRSSDGRVLDFYLTQ
jgi:hypothetical protein